MTGVLQLIFLGLAVIVATAAGLVAFGWLRWAAGTRALRRRLQATRVVATPPRVDFGELDGLPVPVQRYFRTVLRDGQRVVAGVRLRHTGTFDMGAAEAQWKPFTSDQRVVTRRPGFDWNARISLLPGFAVRVHDAYVGGEGLLRASILGLLTIVDLRGTRELAEGELMRFMAEAVWYPTALLPSQGVRWEAVSDHSARATRADGEITLTLLYGFDAEGLVVTVRAEARGRTVGDAVVPTPWACRVANWQERDGMRIPLDGEVAWLLPEGERPYWRGRIASIAYEYAG